MYIHIYIYIVFNPYIRIYVHIYVSIHVYIRTHLYASHSNLILVDAIRIQIGSQRVHPAGLFSSTLSKSHILLHYCYIQPLSLASANYH